MFTRRTATTVSARARRSSRSLASATEPLESRTLFAAVVDNFNDGNDAGWTHYSPLAGLGAPGTFTVEDGAYHITAPTSPAPAQAGPARAGSFRNDANFSDFIASIDIVDWDETLTNQAFGLLARVSTPGLGTTNGYALTYGTSGDLDISLVTGEAPDDLDPGLNVFLDPDTDYRLVFEGHGPTLTGRLIDLTNNTIVAATRAIDSTYTSGIIGLVVYDSTNGGDATADATFDNFSADVAPPDPTVAYWKFDEGGVNQEFQPPAEPGGPGSGLAVDSAGGDDTLRTYSDATNPVYSADVQAATVPATGEVNRRALLFTPNEDLYSEGAPINNHVFNQFTIEASVRFNNLDGWQTFLGKDGNAFPGSPDPNLSSLYFQLANDDANQDHIAFKVHQADGAFKDLYSIDPVVADQWYNVAAVLSNDGTPGDPADQTLSLYIQDPNTGQYVLQDREDFRGGMANQDRTWTVGRGMYANAPADWINGYVDEVRISDAALQPSKFLFFDPTVIVDTPTHVTQVFVNGPGLTAGSGPNNVAFRNLAGVDSTFGYAVPAGANQTKSIPWNGGVNQVAVRFDGPVTVRQDGLVIRGINTATYTPSAFTYDPATNTAVWTLPTITNDRIRLVLDDAAVTGGFGFDGDWTNGNDAYPSGDGAPGGDFDFRVDILRGDATQDGRVNALDLSFVRSKLNKTATNPGTGTTAYSPFADINPDGQINALDLSAVRNRLNTALPSGEPPATALLFSDERV